MKMNTKKNQDGDKVVGSFIPLIEYELITTGVKLMKRLNILVDAYIFHKQYKMLLNFIRELETELRVAKKKLMERRGENDERRKKSKERKGKEV